MIKPTKEGGFWSYTGIYILCYIPFAVAFTVLEYIFAPFIDDNSTLTAVIVSFIYFGGEIAATFKAVKIYAERRIISKNIAKKISLIFLTINGLFAIFYISQATIWPESREFSYNYFIVYALYTIESIGVFYIMRKLLLLKAEYQEDN